MKIAARPSRTHSGADLPDVLLEGDEAPAGGVGVGRELLKIVSSLVTNDGDGGDIIASAGGGGGRVGGTSGNESGGALAHPASSSSAIALGVSLSLSKGIGNPSLSGGRRELFVAPARGLGGHRGRLDGQAVLVDGRSSSGYRLVVAPPAPGRDGQQCPQPDRHPRQQPQRTAGQAAEQAQGQGDHAQPPERCFQRQ